MSLKRIIKKYLRKLYRSISEPTIEKNNEHLLQKQLRLIATAQLHQHTFLKFKGCNQGKSVVIVGAGPSVNQFKPIENSVYIGLNRACQLDNVKFTYLFSIDKLGIEHIYPKFAEYDSTKFIGDQNLGPKFQIPETEVAKMKGDVYRYKTDMGLFQKSRYALDLESEPLGNFNTVSLQAMQFALYTLPEKIYLVGIDCSASGHYASNSKNEESVNERMRDRGENRSQNADDSIRFWYGLKEFADQYYPGIEIISVNPVGLRGLFKDLDQ